jgi:hypothetical protein
MAMSSCSPQSHRKLPNTSPVRHWLWTRTIGSTLVGEGVDTLAFVSIATVLRVPGFDPSIWLTLIVTNYLFKCGVEAIMTLLKGRSSLLSFAEVRKYHRPISWQAPVPVKFPACFVSPERWEPDLTTNGKYEFWGQVGLYVYHDGDDPDAVGEEVSNTVEAHFAIS